VVWYERRREKKVEEAFVYGDGLRCEHRRLILALSLARRCTGNLGLWKTDSSKVLGCKIRRLVKVTQSNPKLDNWYLLVQFICIFHRYTHCRLVIDISPGIHQAFIRQISAQNKTAHYWQVVLGDLVLLPDKPGFTDHLECSWSLDKASRKPRATSMTSVI
jgi:hypothetical protein